MGASQRRVGGPRPIVLWLVTLVAMSAATVAFAREARLIGIVLAVIAGLASAGAVWQWIRAN